MDPFLDLNIAFNGHVEGIVNNVRGYSFQMGFKVVFACCNSFVPHVNVVANGKFHMRRIWCSLCRL